MKTVQDVESLKREGRRLRARRVDEEKFVESSRETALQNGAFLTNVTHGGRVSGKYKGYAETEGLVTVAFPNGYVYQRGVRLSASNVTFSGVLEACLGDWARAYCDKRYGEIARKRAEVGILTHAAVQLRTLDPEFFPDIE